MKINLPSLRISLLLLVLATIMLASCSVKYKLRRANKNFDKGAYASAIEGYRNVLPKIKRDNQPPINLKLAAAYHSIGNTRLAEMMYGNALQRNVPLNDTIALGLAQTKLANEKYADAIKYFDAYCAFHPADSLAAAQLEYCKAMSDTSTAPKQTRYIVGNARELNGPSDDFAPAYMAEDYSVIAFTSSRDGAKGRSKNIITGDRCTDIFSVKQTRVGRWEKATPLKGKVNNRYDNGVCCFTHDYQTMYFTECVAKGSKAACRIYSALYDPENKSWEDVEQVTIPGDSSGAVTAAHPCLSSDETELYFVSDLKDGYGGTDIWKMSRTSGDDGNSTWGTPVNLGADINTAGNEMYPYAHTGGVLYFASDGHKGFGGLDIFKATPADDGGWKVENMGLPINSSTDDFSIILETGRDAGYFASRRKGGRGGDDIYRFVLPEARFTFVGLALNKETLQPMQDIQVEMLTNTGESLKMITEIDGRFSFNLKPETDYLVMVRLRGYLNTKARFSTKGLEDITTLREEFMMQPIDKVIEVEDIYYEFAKWNLLPESEASLNRLVETLNDNPTISIVLTAHTDMHGDTTFNDELSVKRAQAVVDYLISKGISTSRLTSEGRGKRQPREVTAAMAKQYVFLREDDVLDDTFIKQHVHSKEEEAIVDQLNRRTEFIVINPNKE